MSEKKYKIFISYFTGEQDLANKVKVTLNTAFRGKVSFFLSSEQLLPGENWKMVLQEALNEYDAILTIITPRYLTRPWIFIEWTAFWLHNKTTYMVITPDVQISDLAEPMKDSQIASLFREEDMKKLIEKISKVIRQEDIPYDFAFKLATESEIVYGNIKDLEIHRTFGIFKDDLSMLPVENTDKKKIFWYFYGEEDYETAGKVFAKINGGTAQCNLLIELVDKSNLQFVSDLLDTIPTVKQNIVPLFRKLIVDGYIEDPIVGKIIQHNLDSGAAMRKCCETLIDLGMCESEIMYSILKDFPRMSELQAVGRYMIDKKLFNSICFQVMVEKFQSRLSVELSGVLRYAIDKGVHLDTTFNFGHLMSVLADYSQSSAQKTLIYLINKGYSNDAQRLLSILKEEQKKEKVEAEIIEAVKRGVSHKQDLKNLIAEGKLQLAMEKMNDYFQITENIEISNTIIVQMAQLSQFNDVTNTGKYTDEVLKTEKNRIAKAMLQIIDENL